jgi:hypothetical protein
MPWHRDGAVLVLCLTGCAFMGFIPPAYFDGIESARHMAVMNLCLALAFAISVALAGSMIYHGARRGPRRITASAEPSTPELATNRQD